MVAFCYGYERTNERKGTVNEKGMTAQLLHSVEVVGGGWGVLRCGLQRVPNVVQAAAFPLRCVLRGTAWFVPCNFARYEVASGDKRRSCHDLMVLYYYRTSRHCVASATTTGT